jgi:hypothetical protein
VSHDACLSCNDNGSQFLSVTHLHTLSSSSLYPLHVGRRIATKTYLLWRSFWSHYVQPLRRHQRTLVPNHPTPTLRHPKSLPNLKHKYLNISCEHGIHNYGSPCARSPRAGLPAVDGRKTVPVTLPLKGRRKGVAPSHVGSTQGSDDI